MTRTLIDRLEDEGDVRDAFHGDRLCGEAAERIRELLKTLKRHIVFDGYCAECGQQDCHSDGCDLYEMRDCALASPSSEASPQ